MNRRILTGIIVGLISPGLRVYRAEDDPPSWRRARPVRTPRPERRAGRLTVAAILGILGALVILLGIAQKSVLLAVLGLAVLIGGAVVSRRGVSFTFRPR